uniref:Uncharacterized protein n=1 Tax=Trieres chinensis TaxID=1514140 RepID=A0A6U1Z4Q2_TRICV|mmetsp:Transcript_5491/g.11427  ORF Transcript_5491/g.11427 Transcript_5491/m.11427 type:complete len:104 (+) Transcript_5491:229-540(+)
MNGEGRGGAGLEPTPCSYLQLPTPPFGATNLLWRNNLEGYGQRMKRGQVRKEKFGTMNHMHGWAEGDTDLICSPYTTQTTCIKCTNENTHLHLMNLNLNTYDH